MAVFQLGEIRANESNCQITKTYSGNEVGWIRNVCILYQNFGTLDSLLHFSREFRVFIHIQPSTKHFHICICHLALFSVQHLFACLFSTDKQFSGIVNYMFWFVLLERSIHEDNQLGEYFCCCPKLLSSKFRHLHNLCNNSLLYKLCVCNVISCFDMNRIHPQSRILSQRQPSIHLFIHESIHFHETTSNSQEFQSTLLYNLVF